LRYAEVEPKARVFIEHRRTKDRRDKERADKKAAKERAARKKKAEEVSRTTASCERMPRGSTP
jgi:hypothetical protein